MCFTCSRTYVKYKEICVPPSPLPALRVAPHTPSQPRMALTCQVRKNAPSELISQNVFWIILRKSTPPQDRQMIIYY